MVVVDFGKAHLDSNIVCFGYHTPFDCWNRLNYDGVGNFGLDIDCSNGGLDY